MVTSEGAPSPLGYVLREEAGVKKSVCWRRPDFCIGVPLAAARAYSSMQHLSCLESKYGTQFVVYTQEPRISDWFLGGLKNWSLGLDLSSYNLLAKHADIDGRG